MKILPVIRKPVGNILKATVVAGLLLPAATTKSQIKNTIQKDTIELTENNMQVIRIHQQFPAAPPAEIEIAGKKERATLVVDLTNNILYQYNEGGLPVWAYAVATGKKHSPTEEGIRIITGIEKYPYKSAPIDTKRHNNPKDYGPYVVCLATVNPKTGKVIGSDGQFIHGTNRPESIGNNSSKGCVRLQNEAIEELIPFLKKGQYIVFKK